MLITLGISPCPNDTFIFDAIVNKRIETGGIDFRIVMEDVEKLNERAVNAELDVTKLSMNAYARQSDKYQVLNSGAALGKGCGPLLVVKKDFNWKELKDLKIAIPGQFTTANLLLSIFAPEAENKTPMLFSEIENAVISEEYDAGLIIHESRFTYEKKGLKKLADLGELWEQYTGSALPLGCIAIKRSLPVSVKSQIDKLISKSVRYAFQNPEHSRDFIQQHAAGLSREVQEQHISLYVNDYSIDLGIGGKKSIELLFRKGKEAGLLPEVHHPVFAG